MSDEADIAFEIQTALNEAAVSAQVRKAQEAITTQYTHCAHCEENPRPKVIGKHGHPIVSPNCARCMDELGIPYTLA